MLELIKLNKVFLKGTPNENHALRNFNLYIPDGEFITVIGSNGAGKSTLFNAVAGSFFCDSGSILLDGKDITFQKEHRRAREIARIFQNPAMGTAPDLTIEENLALAYSKSTKRPFSRALRKRDVTLFREQLAKLDMGLEERMKTKIGLLSGGQRQAVTLLMATIITPKLLLLDEHTAALDPMTAQKVLAITREIVGKNKITTMMITHNIGSALALGTRTIMLENGGLVLDLAGEERRKLGVEGLLALYQEKCGKTLDNDRMLLTH